MNKDEDVRKKTTTNSESEEENSSDSENDDETDYIAEGSKLHGLLDAIDRTYSERKSLEASQIIQLGAVKINNIIEKESPEMFQQTLQQENREESDIK